MLPRGEAQSRSPSLSSLEGGGTASLLQVVGASGWTAVSSSLSSWIRGPGHLVSLLGVSKSLLSAALNMCVKGVSASLEVSLEMTNIFERVSADVFSSPESEVWSSSGSLSSLKLEMAVIFGKHVVC